MKKTKIICTIGPASENEETLTQMCKEGMNVARLNFSHGSHEEHQKKIDLIKKVREKLGLPIAIMLDTKGPEYRIKTFENGKITLAEGDTFTFTTEATRRKRRGRVSRRLQRNYPSLIKPSAEPSKTWRKQVLCGRNIRNGRTVRLQAIVII